LLKQRSKTDERKRGGMSEPRCSSCRSSPSRATPWLAGALW